MNITISHQPSTISNPHSLIRNPSSPFLIIPPHETPTLLSPLPPEALRLPAETVRLLGELGIARIGQLEALPRRELSSRFGPMLLVRLDQAFGRLPEPVPVCPTAPKFAADWSAEYPTSRRETIRAALEHLIRRVAAMLARCGRGVLRLECRLTLEIPNLQISNLKSFFVGGAVSAHGRRGPSLPVGSAPVGAAAHLRARDRRPRGSHAHRTAGTAPAGDAV